MRVQVCLCFAIVLVCGVFGNDIHGSLTIDCGTSNQFTNTTTNITNLNLICDKPNIIFSEYLLSLKLNGPFKVIKITLKIIPKKDSIFLKATQFSGLSTETLIIDNLYKNATGNYDFLHLDSDIIFASNKVVNLELVGVFLEGSKSLVIGSNSSTGSTTCNLESLKIQISNLRNVTHGWLESCYYLNYLLIAKMLQRNGTKEVRRKILAGLKNLRVLEIHECYIEELNDELSDLVGLQKLDVAYNQIHYALTTTVLPSLEEWNLSYNHLFSSSLLSTGLSKQPKLRYINLDYNTVLNICDQLDYRSTDFDVATWHQPLSGREISLPLVQRFSFRGTITTGMCFGRMKLDSLEYFDLSDSKIVALNFEEIPQSKARRLEINVSGCPIRELTPDSFTEFHYKRLRHEELRITGLKITLNCECDDHFWLARAVRERHLVLNSVFCMNNEDFATVSEDKFNCTKYLCGACSCRRYWRTNDHACKECNCKRFWKDNSTEVECEGELRAIPHEPGLKKLHAAGNLVENVTADDLPDTLIFLDLSKNHIARMSAGAAAALFRIRERKVRLLGNPIICDCENKEFIVQLMDHFDQVEDYTLLTCIDDGRFIRDVLPEDLCATLSRGLITALITASGAILGLIALLAGLYYRYGQAVKVFLYSRGCCLFCINEDEVDSDRPFDAFLSFSHKDYDFVKDNLLPGLEQDPHNYNICIHYRNWVAGELIPTQINRSVEESKRTIIVLSKNFLESIWGLLEFRTAHLSALREGRARVIIVVLDDVLESDGLDSELKSYIRTNTYVKFGEPWFWDKLRYALPHRSTIGNNQRSSFVKNISQQNLSPTSIDTLSTDSAIEMEQFSGELSQVSNR